MNGTSEKYRSPSSDRASKSSNHDDNDDCSNEPTTINENSIDSNNINTNYVSESKQQQQQQQQYSSDEPEQVRKLFIGGLDYKTSEDTLKKHFDKFGDVLDCIVMREPQSQRSRGFGFVIYANSLMVDRAQEARPHELDGREVQTKRAISREDSGKPEAQATVKKVYLGGLSDDIEEAELRNYFKEFGNIVNINIVAHKDTGKRRGFAFVEYDDYDPVDKIVLKKFHTIKDRRVEAKKAIPKVEMDARKRIDPRASMANVMMTMNGARGVRVGGSGIGGGGVGGGGGGLGGGGLNSATGPNYLWEPPYVAAANHWMLHNGQAGGPSGPYGGGAYAAAAAAAAAAAGVWPDCSAFHPHPGLAQGNGGPGPMRHLASYQHRGYRPYGSPTPRGTGRNRYKP